MTGFDPDVVKRRWRRMGRDERADVEAAVRSTLHARALRRLTLSDTPALAELLAWIEEQEEPP